MQGNEIGCSIPVSIKSTYHHERMLFKDTDGFDRLWQRMNSEDRWFHKTGREVSDVYGDFIVGCHVSSHSLHSLSADGNVQLSGL